MQRIRLGPNWFIDRGAWHPADVFPTAEPTPWTSKMNIPEAGWPPNSATRIMNGRAWFYWCGLFGPNRKVCHTQQGQQKKKKVRLVYDSGCIEHKKRRSSPIIRRTRTLYPSRSGSGQRDIMTERLFTQIKGLGVATNWRRSQDIRELYSGVNSRQFVRLPFNKNTILLIDYIDKNAVTSKISCLASDYIPILSRLPFANLHQADHFPSNVH